jgi:hypothetical protein
LCKIRKEVEEEKRIQAESARLRRLVHSQLQEVQEQYLLYLVKEEWLELNIVTERLRQLQLEDLVNEKRRGTICYGGNKRERIQSESIKGTMASLSDVM